jgi:hypothetical protein
MSNSKSYQQPSAFGDELTLDSYTDMQESDFLYAGGLLSRIIGTKESRQATLGRIASIPSRIVGTKASRQASAKRILEAPAKTISRVIGTPQSRAETNKRWASAARTIGLAPSRGALLSLIRLNVFGLATDLKKEMDANSSKWDTVRNKKWTKWGGNRTELEKTIKKGAKKKALRIKFWKNNTADGSLDGTWVGTSDYLNAAGEVAAFLTAAAGLLVPLLGTINKKLDTDTQEEITKQAELQKEILENEQAVQDLINENTTEDQRTSQDDMTPYYIAGGSLVLLGLGAYWYISTRKKE